MHALFITFFSFVAYATGIVAVQRWSNKTHDGAVRPVEVLLGLAVVVCGMFLNKPHYSLQYLAFCLFVMFSIGAVIGIGVLLSKNRGTAGTGEYSDEVGGHGNLSLWKQWLNFSRAVVDYEFRLLLLACYLVVVGPFALLFRAGQKKNTSEAMGSAWLPRSNDNSMEAARRPF